MGASWYKAVMESLPVVPDGVGKMFPTPRARGIIKSQAEAVAKGKDRFTQLSSRGKARLYKQQITGMDRATFTSVVETMKRDWEDFKATDYPGFKMLVESVGNGTWNYDSNVVEEIERSDKGSHLFFYHIKRNLSSGKYDMAICYLEVDQSISTATLVGGMASEGLLARDAQDQVYLQF